MKNNLGRVLVLFLALSAIQPVFAGFDEGLAAAKKGDNATALKEWRPLAEQGDAHAQYNLGLMYANGQGVTQDYQQAVAWYRKATEQGYALAQYNLGAMYDKGRGVTQDYQQAVAWYRKAAEQGDASAQYNLGVMYANGQGVIKDYIEAHKWFNIAGVNGNSGAIKSRELVEIKMTPKQIAEAQRRASAWMNKH